MTTTKAGSFHEDPPANPALGDGWVDAADVLHVWSGTAWVIAKPTRIHEVTGKSVDLCPDGGTCHHLCGPAACFRVATCSPLSGVYPGDRWPADVQQEYGSTYGPLAESDARLTPNETRIARMLVEFMGGHLAVPTAKAIGTFLGWTQYQPPDGRPNPIVILTDVQYADLMEKHD